MTPPIMTITRLEVTAKKAEQTRAFQVLIQLRLLLAPRWQALFLHAMRAHESPVSAISAKSDLSLSVYSVNMNLIHCDSYSVQIRIA